ncbi:MAG: ATP synthase F1 subunit delta [Planctomycetes bacterium]|nr:ATP synthase F1 subunit delta [Planctomycetota bacterium]
MKTGAAAELAETYARSLLEAAQEARAVDAVAADLEVVAALLTQEPELGAFLASPYVGESAKRTLLHEALAGKLHPLTLQFLQVTIAHERGALLPVILDRYRRLSRAYEGYETVKVTVAQSLSPEQTEKLSRDLAAAMRAKIDLEVQVEPAILGGVIIRHGDRMLDNSLRGRLVRAVDQIANPERRNQGIRR